MDETSLSRFGSGLDSDTSAKDVPSPKDKRVRRKLTLNNESNSESEANDNSISDSRVAKRKLIYDDESVANGDDASKVNEPIPKRSRTTLDKEKETEPSQTGSEASLNEFVPALENDTSASKLKESDVNKENEDSSSKVNSSSKVSTEVESDILVTKRMKIATNSENETSSSKNESESSRRESNTGFVSFRNRGARVEAISPTWNESVMSPLHMSPSRSYSDITSTLDQHAQDTTSKSGEQGEDGVVARRSHGGSARPAARPAQDQGSDSDGSEGARVAPQLVRADVHRAPSPTPPRNEVHSGMMSYRSQLSEAQTPQPPPDRSTS